jgi:prolipoprotein diacylglyceryltransferase
MSVFIIGLVTLLIFLFCFYTYAKDDHYFIRKGITLEQLFNSLFVSIFCSILFGRLAYVLFHPSVKYFSPLVFLLIPYFPGISMTGGVIGLFVSMFIQARRRKIHAGRILDYISLAGLISIPIGLFINFLFQGRKDMMQGVYIPIAYIVFFIIYQRLLFPRFSRGALKEGSMSSFFLIIFSLLALLQDVIMLYRKDVLLKTEDFVAMGIFFIASFFLIRIETKKPSK